jgi:ABC-2 type transport system ATP-binding protein
MAMSIRLMTTGEDHDLRVGLDDGEAREPSSAVDSSVVMRVRNIVVRYGPHVALRGVDLNLHRGEVLGLLGPNGAGKSTLMRRLSGLLPSRDGTVEIAGHDPGASRRARSHIGYLPEEPPLYPEETVIRYVMYMAALGGVPRGARRAAALDALERAGAAKLTDRLAGRLSKGQRQRVGFAAAIVHRPDLVLLDEPTSGLDPAQMVKFRGVVRDVARSSAVLFSTHLLAEAQAVCDRVVILDQGTVVADRPVNRRPGTRLRVRVTGADHPTLDRMLLGLPGVTAAAAGECQVTNPAVAQKIVAAVLGQGWTLDELATVPDDLEQAFLDAVAGKQP